MPPAAVSQITVSGARPGRSGTRAAGQESMPARLSLDLRAITRTSPNRARLEPSRHPFSVLLGPPQSCWPSSVLLAPRLLEGIGQGDQPGLAKGRTDLRDANRQPCNRSRRNGDRRVPGDRGRRGWSDGVLVAEHVVGEPGGVAGQGEPRLEAVPGPRRVG